MGVAFAVVTVSSIGGILNATQRIERTNANLSKEDEVDSCFLDFSEYKYDASMCNVPLSPVLDGADVVAYFADGATAARFGSSDYSVIYRGNNFYFANAENAAIFERDPGAYAPKYGGFCSFGLSGEDPMIKNLSMDALPKMPSDPNVFTVLDGSLYMFRGLGAKDLFLESQQECIEGADSTWASWFGDHCDGFYNTLCFYVNLED